MTRDEVITLLRRELPDLARSYHVASLSLFGSVARGEDRPDSDIDLLVEFSCPVSLFGLGALQARLEQILARKVDLGTFDTLRPAFRAQVASEAVRVA